MRLKPSKRAEAKRSRAGAKGPESAGLSSEPKDSSRGVLLTMSDGFVQVPCVQSGSVLSVEGRSVALRLSTRWTPGAMGAGTRELLSKARRSDDVVLSVEGDEKRLIIQTDKRGRANVALEAVVDSQALKGLCPLKGGHLELSGTHASGAQGLSRILALPQGYDGPVLVVDLHPTLRTSGALKIMGGKDGSPREQARALLSSVALLDVPILYLTGSPDRLRAENEAFLKELPKGILIDRSDYGAGDLFGRAGNRARKQAAFKSEVLGDLRRAFPRAQLIGVGDNKSGDAMAYTRQDVDPFLLQARSKSSRLPANFVGQTGHWDEEGLGEQVLERVKEAIAGSASFGNAPVRETPEARLSRILDAVTGTQATMGNSVRPLIDGERALPALLDAINNAKKSICYETFVFGDTDVTAQAVVEALLAAHARGVKVRLVADAAGSQQIPPLMRNPLLKRLKRAGVDLRIYNPIKGFRDLDFSRNHCKTLVVDGATAFLGGMNTADEYMGSPEAKHRRHDVFAEIQGPAVADVLKSFGSTWAAAEGDSLEDVEAHVADAAAEAPEVEKGCSVRIVQFVPGEPEVARAAYLALFDSALFRINVENNFPVSDDVMDSLAAAARRGVDVRLIAGTNTRGSERLMGLVARSKYQEMLDAGVRIFIYPEPVHTKAISVDGRIVTLGSANVDNVSLSRNREIVCVVASPDFVADFDREVFETDLIGSPRGQPTLELPRKLNDAWWKRVASRAVSSVWPESME